MMEVPEVSPAWYWHQTCSISSIETINTGANNNKQYQDSGVGVSNPVTEYLIMIINDLYLVRIRIIFH